MALSWQDVQDEALRRIHSREWARGALIPNEADLAEELGCARATVNRALRALARAGWLERRRKAGTRVALTPQRRAELAIPILREEIEARGERFSHAILAREISDMPPHLRATLRLPDDAETCHVRSLYMADGRAYALENRWVNLAAAPDFVSADLQTISPNEWLVLHAPFAHGTFEYTAVPAGEDEAAHLDCPIGAPVMRLKRRTFGPQAPVTHVRLTYAPGFQLHLSI
jgi:GntR family transcriptional regulator, histidine utilization repressor